MVAVRLIFSILGASLLMGCSTAPTEYPDCKIPAPMVEVGHPVSVPEMPIETRRIMDGDDVIGVEFDVPGIEGLTRVRIAAVTNEKVAEENALAIEARNAEVNALIECARYMGVWIQVHAEDLNDEKRAHFISNLWYQSLIALGVIAAVAL